MKASHYFLFIASTLLLFSCISPGKSFVKARTMAPFDVIIVPGVPFENHDWGSDIMKNRVLWSWYLYSSGITRNVIYSGDAVYTPYVEGKVMALYALALGIPMDHVYSETKAEHSTENLVYSYRMAKKLGFTKIAVATDPFQANALISFAWDVNIPVTFIPIIYDSLEPLRKGRTLHIDPSKAFVDGFVPLPRRESWFKRFRGTLGLEVSQRESE